MYFWAYPSTLSLFRFWPKTTNKVQSRFYVRTKRILKKNDAEKNKEFIYL